MDAIALFESLLNDTDTYTGAAFTGMDYRASITDAMIINVLGGEQISPMRSLTHGEDPTPVSDDERREAEQHMSSRFRT